MQSRMLVIALITFSSILLLLVSSLIRSGSPLRPPSRPCFSSLHHLHEPILKVFVADLPEELNYGLLHEYWSFHASRDITKGSKENARSSKTPRVRVSTGEFSSKSILIPPYPDDPLIKQYSAEYWLLGDLMTPENARSNSVARRVWNSSLADVIFVPFFATMSAELQLHQAKGTFRHIKNNSDYERQVMVMKILKDSPEWKRSQGRDHIFVLTDPVAMWHMRSEVAPAVLLTVDFGGWYMEDAKEPENHLGPLNVISHSQVSLLKDVVVPYTHLLPPLHLAGDKQRSTLLYFKGARHRHRMGLVRDKLWAVLKDEHGVIFEEGFPNTTGREQSLKGMRGADFCLHPAGDTPTSCRLFDAIMSLCIPVIVSDSIELPFEGILDYMEFSLFVAVHSALEPKFLVNYLKGVSDQQKQAMRTSMAAIQHLFEYNNGYPGGVGPAKGAVNAIWKKVLDKVPKVREAIVRERRKPLDILTLPMLVILCGYSQCLCAVDPFQLNWDASTAMLYGHHCALEHGGNAGC